jgi:hypothetical protein
MLPVWVSGRGVDRGGFVGVEHRGCGCGGERFAGLGVAEEQAVAARAGGQDAIHHVDTHARILLYLVGVADAHDIPGFVGGEEFEGAGDHLTRDFAGFADGEASDGVTVEVHLDEAEGGLAAEVGIHAALDDAEEGLRCFELLRPGDFVFVGFEVLLGARGPGVGESHGVAGALPCGGGLDALVEGHEDVGAECDLHLDGVLGREEVRGAVEVGAELNAFGRDLAQLGKGEDLEAAGVGEQGARPGHEAVQAAEAADGVVAGAKVEVVGVGEDDCWSGGVRAEAFQQFVGDRLDGGGGAYGHEDGRLDRAVGEMQGRAASAFGCGRGYFEAEGHLSLW